jgi:hypothetical protein
VFILFMICWTCVEEITMVREAAGPMNLSDILTASPIDPPPPTDCKQDCCDVADNKDEFPPPRILLQQRETGLKSTPEPERFAKMHLPFCISKQPCRVG